MGLNTHEVSAYFFFIRNHKDNKHRNDGGEKTNQVKKTEREKKNQSKKKCWPAENFSNIIFVFFIIFPFVV